MEREKNEDLLQEAKELIREKRFDDARALLITIDHPQADTLLKKLEASNFVGDANTNDKSGLLVLVVCILLGYLGIHRFMTGHIIIGLIQLLTGGGFGLWWLFDIIMIVTGNYKDYEGNIIKLG